MSATPEVPAAQPDPDAKDWTWVLQRPCPECGFNATATDPTTVAALLADNIAAWHAVLSDPEAALQQRPTPTTWSAAEYAAHVRDVFAIMDQRLVLMLTQDAPRYANWEQDATAIAERYDLQTPAQIRPELVSSGGRLADRFGSVRHDQWQRTGHRSDGAAFTVASFSLYVLHDPVHHLHDVRAGLAAMR